MSIDTVQMSNLFRGSVMKTLYCILFYFLIIKIIGRAQFLQVSNPLKILFILMHCCFKQKVEDARKVLTISGTGVSLFI